MRFVTGVFCALFVLTSVAHAQQQSCGEALNLEDADIRSVVDEIALRTGKKFVIDPRVSGRITIKSPPNGGLCPEEAWELFQAALRVTGFTATPINGDSYKVIPIQEGARAAGPVGKAEAGDFVTQIVRLNHVDAREAAANLAQIISERGVVAPVRSSNAVILVDSSDNIRRLREVLAQIDRDTTVYRTVPLENASATEVARVVSKLAQELQQEGGQTTAGNVSVVPVPASNSILIRAEPQVLNRLIGVVTELDRIGQTKSDLSVISLNHADAEEMATLLREIANAQPPALGGAGGDPAAAPAAPSGDSRATITFHKPTNSVIISGDADIQQTLRRVVEQLDVRRPQVQIEAIIVEVSDNTARELGVQYFLTPTNSSKRIPFTATNFQSAQTNLLASAGSLLLNNQNVSDALGNPSADTVTDAALSSLLATNGLIGGVGGRIGKDIIFGAVLNALKRDTQSNILSLPSVVTLDNQEASLSVGQEIPITTGEAAGNNFSNVFRQVSREEVGIILKVTPQINEGGTVTLKIEQESSSIAGQIISSSTDLITNKRVISTTALVDDGDLLVIGGLIDQTDELTEDKVPLLGDIPVAGNLFKSSGRRSERRNLLVFLRPTIIRSREDAAAVTQKKFDYIRAQEVISTGRSDTALEKLIRNATGAAPRPEYETQPTPVPAQSGANEPTDLDFLQDTQPQQ
ncbi:MAG: type II secretion system secretin GspD [Parvularculaceae bacterium]